jgi:putative transposase
LTVTAVDDAAWELGVSRATLYRLVERYRATRTVEGLCGPGRGCREGTRFLNPAQETLIREIIECAKPECSPGSVSNPAR